MKKEKLLNLLFYMNFIVPQDTKEPVFFKEKFGAFEVEIQVNAFAKHLFTPIPEAGSNPHQTKLGGEAMVTVTLAKW